MKLVALCCVLCLALGVVVMSCKSGSSNPSSPLQATLAIDSSIVRYDSLGVTGGSGYYYKFIVSTRGLDPSRADSVFTMLLDSGFVLEEFWYPNEPSLCADPFNHNREVVRLAAPDTNITRLGYTSFATNFADACIQHWRQYRFIRSSGGS